MAGASFPVKVVVEERIGVVEASRKARRRSYVVADGRPFPSPHPAQGGGGVRPRRRVGTGARGWIRVEREEADVAARTVG